MYLDAVYVQDVAHVVRCSTCTKMDSLHYNIFVARKKRVAKQFLTYICMLKCHVVLLVHVELIKAITFFSHTNVKIYYVISTEF